MVYIKLLILWSLVLLADYFLEFRFEYLWPFWLFLRSVYDSFKYQGLVNSNPPQICLIHFDQTNLFLQAFSVFFICIAITSDMICFLFIPVHWLFFAASTYVWVILMKEICLLLVTTEMRFGRTVKSNPHLQGTCVRYHDD